MQKFSVSTAAGTDRLHLLRSFFAFLAVLSTGGSAALLFKCLPLIVRTLPLPGPRPTPPPLPPLSLPSPPSSPPSPPSGPLIGYGFFESCREVGWSSSGNPYPYGLALTVTFSPDTDMDGVYIEAATPEGSACGWFYWPKLCWLNLLCACCIIAVSGVSIKAFAYYSQGSFTCVLDNIAGDLTQVTPENQRMMTSPWASVDLEIRRLTLRRRALTPDAKKPSLDSPLSDPGRLCQPYLLRIFIAVVGMGILRINRYMASAIQAPFADDAPAAVDRASRGEQQGKAEAKDDEAPASATASSLVQPLLAPSSRPPPRGVSPWLSPRAATGRLENETARERAQD